MAPRYVQNTRVSRPANKDKKDKGTTTTTPKTPTTTPPTTTVPQTTTTVPQSPPSATLIPQKPTDPGYTDQTPKTFKNNPTDYEKQVEEGRKAAEAEIKKQKELLAAIKAATGSGSGVSAALTKNAKAIQQALKSGSYGKTYDDLLTKLTGASTAAQEQINTGYAGLKSLIEGQSNPYASLQFTPTQAEAPLLNFLQSQGGSADALKARLEAENVSNTQAANQFQNIATLLGQRQVTGNNQRVADVEAARLAALQDLQTQGAGFGFNIEQQKQAERNRLNQILLELASKGVNVGGIY